MATALTPNSQSKYWCFTINNPENGFDELNSVKNWAYMVAGKEVGKEGTPHLQCFVAFNGRHKFPVVKRMLPTAHIERMISTPVQAAEYCKKDGDYVEFGTLPDYYGGKAGGDAKHERYNSAIELSKSGNFNAMEDLHPDMFWNNYNTMKRVAMDHPAPVRDLEFQDNEWIWGQTGVGKSYMARKENPGFFLKLHNKWWLGYRGEEFVIYDDLSRSDAGWIGDFLKTWGDRYSFACETKYGGSTIRPKRIIITSNYSIDELFGHDEDLCAAIKRRYKSRHIIIPFKAILAEGPNNEVVIPRTGLHEEDGDDYDVIQVEEGDCLND